MIRHILPNITIEIDMKRGVLVERVRGWIRHVAGDMSGGGARPQYLQVAVEGDAGDATRGLHRTDVRANVADT